METRNISSRDPLSSIKNEDLAKYVSPEKAGLQSLAVKFRRFAHLILHGTWANNAEVIRSIKAKPNGNLSPVEQEKLDKVCAKLEKSYVHDFFAKARDAAKEKFERAGTLFSQSPNNISIKTDKDLETLSTARIDRRIAAFKEKYSEANIPNLLANDEENYILLHFLCDSKDLISDISKSKDPNKDNKNSEFTEFRVKTLSHLIISLSSGPKDQTDFENKIMKLTTGLDAIGGYNATEMEKAKEMKSAIKNGIEKLFTNTKSTIQKSDTKYQTSHNDKITDVVRGYFHDSPELAKSLNNLKFNP